MMNDNTRKWIEALRSGEFEQGQGALRKGNQYCCLGVACELYRREHPDSVAWDLIGLNMTFYGKHSTLPIRVRDWIGLRTIDGSYQRVSLINMNDDGYTFEEIADVIESEPEGLFR